MTSPEMIRHRLVGSVDEILRRHELRLSGDVDTAQVQRWQRSLAEVMSEDEQREMGRVVEALRRIDSGLYGTCADCGEQIGTMRLIDNPTADRCESCESDDAWRPVRPR